MYSHSVSFNACTNIFTLPSKCISQSMSLKIQKHDHQNSKFKNMTLKNMTLKLYLSKYVSHNSKTWPSKFKNMTLKVYLSKHYCISQKFSKYVPKNSKHDRHNSKTWPSKCISQSVSLKVAIFNAPDLIQILPRHNSWGGASLYSSSLVLGGLARDKIGLKLDCLVQGNKTRNQFHQTAQPHLSYGPKGSYSGSSFLEKG